MIPKKFISDLLTAKKINRNVNHYIYIVLKSNIFNIMIMFKTPNAVCSYAITSRQFQKVKK